MRLHCDLNLGDLVLRPLTTPNLKVLDPFLSSGVPFGVCWFQRLQRMDFFLFPLLAA